MQTNLKWHDPAILVRTSFAWRMERSDKGANGRAAIAYDGGSKIEAVRASEVIAIRPLARNDALNEVLSAPTGDRTSIVRDFYGSRGRCRLVRC